jgi:hypothetical protein
VTGRARTEKATEVVVTPTSDYDDATTITLGDGIVIDGWGTKADGSAVNITAGGA